MPISSGNSAPAGIVTRPVLSTVFTQVNWGCSVHPTVHPCQGCSLPLHHRSGGRRGEDKPDFHMAPPALMSLAPRVSHCGNGASCQAYSVTQASTGKITRQMSLPTRPPAVGPRYLVDQRHLAPVGISSNSEPVKLTTPTSKQLAFSFPGSHPHKWPQRPCGGLQVREWFSCGKWVRLSCSIVVTSLGFWTLIVNSRKRPENYLDPKGVLTAMPVLEGT